MMQEENLGLVDETELQSNGRRCTTYRVLQFTAVVTLVLLVLVWIGNSGQPAAPTENGEGDAENPSADLSLDKENIATEYDSNVDSSLAPVETSQEDTEADEYAVEEPASEDSSADDYIEDDLPNDPRLMDNMTTYHEHAFEFGESDSDQNEEYLNNLYQAELCEEARSKNYPKNSHDYEIASANCGWGYAFRNSSATTKPWDVVFLGSHWTRTIRDLSGCPATCPLSPKCRIRVISRYQDFRKFDQANVIVMFQTEASTIMQYLRWKYSSRLPKQYKVLYQREARLRMPVAKTQRAFDFEMGVHYYSSLLNPSFLRSPAQLLSGAFYPNPPLHYTPGEHKSNFMMSAISFCGSTSMRNQYIDRLESILGSERVHRYGDCGNRKLPPKPINNAAKLVATYKFFLSFENTVQEGYVTEKLFFILNIPVVPVYYGANNVPNITTTPSYIKVSDFSAPAKLAAYLMYLDTNHAEYDKYHEWRKSSRSFELEYLKILQDKVAGPEEKLVYKDAGFKRYPRTAQCCRLCDENYVKHARATRKLPKSLVITARKSQIVDRFFGRR